MDVDQLDQYLSSIDHPPQLPLSADVSCLYWLYRAHVTRFAYQNLDLYLGRPPADLSLPALLRTVPVSGGLCYQHTELMLAVLERVGFRVSRVAAWVLLGRQYEEDMPVNHNILVVEVGQDRYICDPGLASATPRYSL